MHLCFGQLAATRPIKSALTGDSKIYKGTYNVEKKNVINI